MLLMTKAPAKRAGAFFASRVGPKIGHRHHTRLACGMKQTVSLCGPPLRRSRRYLASPADRQSTMTMPAFPAVLTRRPD
jgi:hypothetical protein